MIDVETNIDMSYCIVASCSYCIALHRRFLFILHRIALMCWMIQHDRVSWPSRCPSAVPSAVTSVPRTCRDSSFIRAEDDC
jgi:hypothetical protein